MIAPVNVYDLSTLAQLDYWCGRADGIPSEELSIETVLDTDEPICVRRAPGAPAATRYDPSTNPALAWPIIERETIRIEPMTWYIDPPEIAGRVMWSAGPKRPKGICKTIYLCAASGETSLIAAIRSFVKSVYNNAAPSEAPQ